MMTSAGFLTQYDMMMKAPSIFASRPDNRVSDRYSFIPTCEIIDALSEEGWLPVQAGQNKSRNDPSTVRHLVRFRHQGQTTMDFSRTVGGVFPELVVTNSHNASSSFMMQAGLFRLVCSNGMIVSAASSGKIQLIHTNLDKFTVLEEATKILQAIPRLQENVERFRSIELHRPEQMFLARASARIRWGANIPVEMDDLLVPRRMNDRGTSLWTTFNVLQEHLTKGGLRGLSTSGRRIRTQRIRNIDNDIRLNDQLWMTAEWMAGAIDGGRNNWPETDIIDIEKDSE